jgi:hypothetical protein
MDATRVLVVVAVCLAALVAVAAGTTETFVGHQVLRFSLVGDDGEKRVRLGAAVRSLGLDLWAEHPNWADVQVPANLRENVDALGLPYTVLIDDLQNLINLERLSIQVPPTIRFLFTYYLLQPICSAYPCAQY